MKTHVENHDGIEKGFRARRNGLPRQLTGVTSRKCPEKLNLQHEHQLKWEIPIAILAAVAPRQIWTKMNPIAIITLFFLVLTVLIGVAAFAEKGAVRVVAALATLCWAGVMFFAASWADSLNYNIWYSDAASGMLKAFISNIEAGRQESVLREMKQMTNELEVTYERRGNFKSLAERAARNLSAQACLKSQAKPLLSKR